MSWSLVQVSKPSELAVSLDEAKLHLRVEHDVEDSLIKRIVAAATERAEEIQERAFVTQTFRLGLPRFPRGRILRLPRPPLQSVTSIVYLGRDGQERELPANTYRVDTDAVPGRVILNRGHDWPATADEPDAVRVTYVAGYGGPEAVPEEQRAAILLFVGHLFEMREAVTIGTGPTFKIAYGPEYLLWPDRVFPFDPLGGGS